METNDFIYVGEDLGMGANKLHGARGGVQVLSLVSSNGTAHIEEGILSGRGRQKPMYVLSDAGGFFVGENAHDYGTPMQNLAFERLAGTSEIRSIFYAGLARYQNQFGMFDRPLAMMVGLPFQMLIGTVAKEYKAAVKKWIIGVHEFSVDGKEFRVEVAEAQLKPQAMGILFDYTYSDDGIMLPDKARYWIDETAGLSIGRKTVEFMLTRDSADIERFIGGVDMGVTRLLEDINRHYDGLFTLGELDMKLRNRRIDKDVLKRALDDYQQRVSGAINDRWGDVYRRFEAVLVVGGGAELLRPYLPAMLRGKAIVMDDPVGSISHGLYKMALKYKKRS